MSIALTRESDSSIARYASPYLLSAACVLLGGFLLIRDTTSGHWLDNLPHVFGTQVAYSACLLAVGAYLLRVRRRTEEGYLLLALLSLFALDALGLQHLYGWVDPPGVKAAKIGGVTGVLLLAGSALVLGFRPWSRLAATAVAAVAFLRFAPFLLVNAPAASDHVAFAPRHVALGWLLAAACLPALFWPGRARPDVATRREKTIERIGIFGSLAFATGHFVAAGNSFALPFRVAYLAPLLIVAPALVERLAPGARQQRWARLLLDLGPFGGLLLTATAFSPSLLDARWANRIPLTAFFLALILLTAVTAFRAARLRHVGLAHAAVALGALVLLGGDLPEVLARLRFPAWWQATLVAIACWGAMAVARRFEAGLPLHGLASFAATSALAESWRLPWTSVFLMLLAMGLLAHARACGVVLPRTYRALATATVVYAALGTLAAAHGEAARLVLALGAAALLAALGVWIRDRFYLASALVLLGSAAVVKIVGVQVVGDIPTGRLLIELGFALLLLGVLNSVVGSRVGPRLRAWWEAWA